LSTASTSPAQPSSAGPTSDQSSPSADNSVGDHESSTRHEGGADSSNPSPPKQAKPKQQAKQQEPDNEPEFEFSDGRKRKRSEVERRLSEISKGAQQANERAKQFEAKVQAFSKHLEKLGIDPEQFEKDPDRVFEEGAQKYITRKLEEATLDPKERELRDLKAQNEKFKTEEQKRADEARKAEHQKQVDANADQIANHFATALKEHGLPVNAMSVWRMAALAQAARKSGKRISLADLAKMTDGTVKSDLTHYLPQGDVKALKALVGDGWMPKGDVKALKDLYGADWPEMAEAIRRDLLSEHEAKFSPQPKQPKRDEPGKPPIVSQHPNGYYSLDEWNRAQARRRR
jgi:hypothetical protein